MIFLLRLSATTSSHFIKRWNACLFHWGGAKCQSLKSPKSNLVGDEAIAPNITTSLKILLGMKDLHWCPAWIYMGWRMYPQFWGSSECGVYHHEVWASFPCMAWYFGHVDCSKRKELFLWMGIHVGWCPFCRHYVAIPLKAIIVQVARRNMIWPYGKLFDIAQYIQI